MLPDGRWYNVEAVFPLKASDDPFFTGGVEEILAARS